MGYGMLTDFESSLNGKALTILTKITFDSKKKPLSTFCECGYIYVRVLSDMTAFNI